MPEDITPLTEEEKELLKQCEATIQESIFSFRSMCTALHTIQESRLYRASYGTYEGYVRARWSSVLGLMTKQHIYRLASAGEVIETLEQSNQLVTLPTNEAQTRALSQVPEDKQVEVWQETLAATDNKPTAAAVKSAASRVLVDSFFEEPKQPKEDERPPTPDAPPEEITTYEVTLPSRSKPARKNLVAFFLDGDSKNGRGGNQVWIKPESRGKMEESRARVFRNLLQSNQIAFDIRVGFLLCDENVEDILNEQI